MSDIKLWIDADSCPLLVRNHVVKTAATTNLTVNFVANKNISCDFNNFNMIITEQTKDSADNYIFENAGQKDLVITKDIIFASRLVEKQIAVINDRGIEFTTENIKELLSEREYNYNLSQIGLVKHFHEGYDNKKFKKFADCFDKVLNRLIRNI
ncbi:MAG: DUF188 domain-containing protein [Treponema sp.]|nr:DUF188 domain-containing protein [Treponema sp.]